LLAYNLNTERVSQLMTAGGREFQVAGAAQLKDCLPSWALNSVYMLMCQATAHSLTPAVVTAIRPASLSVLYAVNR